MKTLPLAVAFLLLAAAASGQNLRFAGSDFASWAHPQGLVEVLPQGIKVKRFEQRFNAVANAREFSAKAIGDYGQRFARTPSNQQQADLAGDQDPNTWWQPDPDTPVQLWWLELDLGRSVVADKVRVRFPNREGAKPFNFFSLYVSPAFRYSAVGPSASSIAGWVGRLTTTPSPWSSSTSPRPALPRPRASI